ncbi:hypothetical protein ONZ43_g7497 [Nemania bipapillata]|uniref:Uncharacterized protein n=1 Tax=Nemania bipapillata TaxID=110536 RepID=A0ACC2HQU0_9PEZI|nr:hypothetical protein ONZ43_g7497 [Nemania bipapillata]
MLGVKELRTKLSEVLLGQIATELPSLVTEIDDKLQECRGQLDQLGEPRATVHEQRLYLIKISQKFQSLVDNARVGTYTDPFFEKADTDLGYQQRLRAVIQNLNRQFAKEMAQSGHARKVLPTKNTSSQQNAVTRDAFIKEVQELMRRTRGRELPGRFNSLIVTDLFLEQSKPWRKIVTNHVDGCWVATKQCLELAVTSVAGGPAASRLLQNVIHPALEVLREEVASKANELIDSQVLYHPVTYNEQYLEAVHNINDQRRREFCSGVIENFFGSTPTSSVYMHSRSYDFNTLINQLSRRQEMDDEQFAASEAIDCMEAYYSVALKRLIDHVAIEVIERKLMTALSTILSPIIVFDMSEDLVSVIAGESESSRAKRFKLANQVDVLIKGSETCKHFAGVQFSDLSSWTRDDESQTEDATSVTTNASELTHSLDQFAEERPVESAEVECYQLAEEIGEVPVESAEVGRSRKKNKKGWK